MTIHHDVLGIIAWVWIICIIVILLSLKFIPFSFISYPISAIAVFVMIFIFYFFPVPSRPITEGENIVTSVADGEVVIIEKVYEPEYLKSECIQVSVYMDFFNVHVNFWPISGECTYYKYHPGKYLLAFLPKASELNEHTSMAIKNEHGEIFFKQLAGTFAKRIVCYADPGKSFKKGSQCGLIKFGSRIDMYLPLDCEIKVELGDEVRACETVIAALKPKEELKQQEE